VIVEINQEKSASCWSSLHNMHIIVLVKLILVKLLYIDSLWCCDHFGTEKLNG